MRLPARLIVTAYAGALAGGLAAACTAPSASLSLARSAAHAPWTSKPATSAPSPAASPAMPPLRVAGAPRRVLAKGAALADATTGQVLWGRDMNVERPIASVTKVMTALLVIDAGNLDRQVRIPRAALDYMWKQGGTSAGLHPGDVLTVHQLLEGLMLPSGADAAYTLATSYGPGMNAFIARMNATAARLGMAHTHFTSPDGLPYPTEFSSYSTPADLLRLGLAAMRSPVFRSIVDQSSYQLRKGPGHQAYWWHQTNYLIGHYPGAIGIKTGYTNDAGHCLLFEAVRNGRALIGAVLGSPAAGAAAAALDAAQMLNWGFTLSQAQPGPTRPSAGSAA